jgi:hypothetical protein
VTWAYESTQKKPKVSYDRNYLEISIRGFVGKFGHGLTATKRIRFLSHCAVLTVTNNATSWLLPWYISIVRALVCGLPTCPVTSLAIHPQLLMSPADLTHHAHSHLDANSRGAHRVRDTTTINDTTQCRLPRTTTPWLTSATIQARLPQSIKLSYYLARISTCM